MVWEVGGKGGMGTGAKGKVEPSLEAKMPRVRERTTDNSLPLSFVIQIGKVRGYLILGGHSDTRVFLRSL